MGRFKLGTLKVPLCHFSFLLGGREFGPLPKNSGPNPVLLWVGVTLGPWKPPHPPPPPLGQILATCLGVGCCM